MITWSEQKVPVSALVPYERNPRRISPAARARLKASMQEMGYHQRMIVQPDLRVIGGHQRLSILKELGISEIAVLIPNRELSPKEFSRLLIQDNLPFGDFDFEMLGADFKLDELKAWGMPDDWAKKIKPKFDDEKAEETPPLRDKVTSAPGDIWLLGGHRVMCGSSTNADDVTRLLNGSKPNLMVTDPPYGVGYEYDQHDDTDNEKNAKLVHNAFKFGPPSKVWTCGLSNLARDIQRFGKAKTLVWYKKFAASGSGLGGASTWEPILVVNAETKHLKNDVIEIMTEREMVGDKSLRTFHSCPKPTKLWRELIGSFSNSGETIYDPFLGSGTTVIAAEGIGRTCYGMEISPQYVDLICRRFTQFTGKPSVLDGDGRPFDEIEKSRS